MKEKEGDRSVLAIQQKEEDLKKALQRSEEERLHLLQKKFYKNRQLVELRKQLRRHQKIRQNKEKRVTKILQSRSWRFSKPLRKIGGLLKGQSPPSTKDSAKNPDVPSEQAMSARALHRKLWAGYSSYAFKHLNELKECEHAPMNERLRAAQSLVQWYFDQKEYTKAYDELLYIHRLRPSRQVQANQIIFEIKILQKLGENEKGLRRVWQAIQREGLQSELCLSMVHLHENEQNRLHWLNMVYEQKGLHPLEKKHPKQPLSLKNIHAPFLTKDQIRDHKRVSIIIPAYNAEDLIHIPLESLLNQTLQNIEIIVVDDCSTDQTVDIVQSYAKKDSRIRFIQKPKNEGAYAARNTGLQYVTGDFITIHDSDDWSHSQKLEIQLKELLNAPEAVASISFLARVLPDATPINAGSLLGSKFLIMNSSSLMIHKSVMEKLGSWDLVRAAGDSEFIWRIEEAFGPRSIIRVCEDVPLSLALSDEYSLTGMSTTHIKTIMFGLRRTYREAFEWWHQQAKSLQDFMLDPKKEERPFPSPIPNLTRKKEKRTYKVIFIADFSTTKSVALLRRIQAFFELKRKEAAIFHWYDYSGDPFAKIQDGIFQLVQETDMDLLVPDEKVECVKLICLTPHIFDYRLEKIPQFTFREAILLGNKEEVGHPERKERIFKQVFKQPPRWKSVNTFQ